MRKPTQPLKYGLSIFILIIMVFLANCSTLNTIIKEGIKEPQVKVQNVEVSGLDFQAIDLMFNIQVENPNSLGIKLNGFDYDFAVNQHSFLKGENNDGLEIVANGGKTVQLPLTVGYTDLFNTIKSIQKEDRSSYELKAGFSFDVPVLGSLRIPVSKSGELPIVKLPTISLGSIRLKKLNLSGADLELAVNVDNPNGFSLDLLKMQYNLDVNGSNWISGISNETLAVAEHGKSTLRLPVSLNFLELGSSVYQIINGNKELSYRFNGNVNLASSLPMLPKANLDFDKTGNMNISR